MANYQCAISGLQLKTTHMPMCLEATDLAHPIFYLDHKKLLGLYVRYTKGDLNSIDSYLLFLALLNSTDRVKWQTCCTYAGAVTDRIVATNIDMLVHVIWQSDIISHPSFKQPKLIISLTNSNARLTSIRDWIKRWEDNIDLFKQGRARALHVHKLEKLEAKLSKVILSGTTGPHLASSVATWAAKAGEFPEAVSEAWQLIIRKCYNSEAMFTTPKAQLEEIQSYCYLNIEAGSIHFHSLMQVLNEGIARHSDFLGLGDIGSDKKQNYAIIAEDTSPEAVATMAILAGAPKTAPVRTDYPDAISFLRAKLAFSVSKQYEKVEDSITFNQENTNHD